MRSIVRATQAFRSTLLKSVSRVRTPPGSRDAEPCKVSSPEIVSPSHPETPSACPLLQQYLHRLHMHHARLLATGEKSQAA